MFFTLEFYSTGTDSAENISSFPFSREIKSEGKEENTNCLYLCCQKQNTKNHKLSASYQ